MTAAHEPLVLTRSPVARAEMRIRRPVDEVFQAFVDPAVTTRFWFTKSSGKLEPGAEVTWEWEMYDVSTKVFVHEVVPNERLRIEWDGYGGRESIEWRFAPQSDNTTFVTIMNEGFTGTGDEVANQAIESAAAFALVLSGAKAVPEHDINLNLIADHSP